MSASRFGALAGVVGFLGLFVTPAAAQAPRVRPAWGRVSVYFQTGSIKDVATGETTSTNEVITSFTWRSGDNPDGTEFAFDGRAAAYPGNPNRQTRTSIYDGYVGYRVAGGRLGVRGGQMWIDDLGGLGAVAGALVEVRRKDPAKLGRLRVGAFGGLEPTVLQVDYVPDVRKAGGYVAFDGENGRRHVVGYVNVRNSGLTERSVVTTTNFVPAGRRFFLYQALEYDLVGPAGQGGSRLSYMLANARATATSRVEVMGSYHRGRSVDTRGLTLDVLHGRPVSSKSLEGLLFESMGSRVFVTVAPRVRVTGGYSRDRTNRDSVPTDRYNFGGNAWNIGGTGLDFNVSRSSTTGAGRSYSSWDVSVGRSMGARLYLTGDYSTALSVVHLTNDINGIVVDERPRTKRYSVSALSNLNRHYSLLCTLDWTDDVDVIDRRVLSGLMVRF